MEHGSAAGSAAEVNPLRDFAERYAAAWCRRRAAEVAAFYSPDGLLTVNGGDPAVGRTAIAKVAQSFMTAFPDMRVLLDDLLVDGELVRFCWTLIGTNTGPGGTGHPVRISGYEAWRMGADGLIAESQGSFDGTEYERQLSGGAAAS